LQQKGSSRNNAPSIAAPRETSLGISSLESTQKAALDAWEADSRRGHLKHWTHQKHADGKEGRKRRNEEGYRVSALDGAVERKSSYRVGSGLPLVVHGGIGLETGGPPTPAPAPDSFHPFSSWGRSMGQQDQTASTSLANFSFNEDMIGKKRLVSPGSIL
jgi:hypothetical protein